MNVKRSAGVYLHPDVLIIHAQRLTTAGFSIATTPVFKLAAQALPEEVGDTLRKVLDVFQHGFPDPTDWKHHRAEFLKATGMKSWKALEGIPTRSCWIWEQDERINFTPLRNGGSQGSNKGFQPFGRASSAISIDATNKELGEALFRALGESQ